MLDENDDFDIFDIEKYSLIFWRQEEISNKGKIKKIEDLSGNSHYNNLRFRYKSSKETKFPKITNPMVFLMKIKMSEKNIRGKLEEV